MPANSHAFDAIDSVPVHYAREPIAPYGSRGIHRTFWCDEDLMGPLGDLIREIKENSPPGFGALECVTSAGAFVDKPGQHGRGKAFDLDGLFWENISLIATEQETKTALYLAVQALCNRHFGVVLGFNYNRAHQDHLHFDLGRSVRFRTVQSVTYFVQEAVNALYGESIAVDGEWGSQTSGALTRVRNRLGVGPLSNADNWRAFLLKIAVDAFDIAEQRRALGF